MASKMLIDAAHPEETRVVVVKGNRVEEFDYESASKKQLRGNIYLAKVTRVEPSLQAAFVDYGGNRHGFLAFTEIHPDYYQIPVADRQALLEEEAQEESRARDAEAAEDEAAAGRRRRRGRRGRGRLIKRTTAGRSRGKTTQFGRDAVGADRGARGEGETETQETNAGLAMEASDLVHEVSEAAGATGPDVEAEHVGDASRRSEEVEDDEDESRSGRDRGSARCRRRDERRCHRRDRRSR